MPRAILVYRLPQEADEHQAAVDGWKWREVLRDLAHAWKHCDYMKDARRELLEAITEAGLELWD